MPLNKETELKTNNEESNIQEMVYKKTRTNI